VHQSYPPPTTPQHHNTALDHPHYTTPRPPPVSRRKPHTAISAGASWSIISLHTHFAGSAPAKQNDRDRQTARKRERRGKHREVLWQGTWFRPPLRTQHAPSAADYARGRAQSGQEKLGGGGGRRNPPYAGGRLHSAAVALPRTCEKATKPRFGRTCLQLPTCELRYFRTSPPDGRKKVRSQVGARWGACPSGHGRGQRDASNGASAPWSGDGEQDHGEYARDRQDTSLTCTP
jgi:hypothetical protein